MLAQASDWPAWHTPAPEPLPEFVTLVIRESLGKALIDSGASRSIGREILPQYIVKRRWFGLKDQSIESTRIAHLTNIGEAGARSCSARSR